MKQRFKQTLLATAVAVTCGSALAGDIAVTVQVHSLEGLEGVTANQTSNAISYTLGASYTENDLLTFTFPDGALVTSSFPGTITVPAVNDAVEANARNGLTLGLLGSSATEVTYRVTQINVANNGSGIDWQDTNTVGASVPLGSVQYTPASVLAANVTVTATSETANGRDLDTSGTRTGTVARAATQFGTATVGTPFSSVIDVSEMRKAFVGGGSSTMSWSVANPDTTGWLNVASVNATAGTVVTVKGEAGKFSGLTAGNFTSGGTEVVSETDASVTATYTGMTTNDTITFTPTTGDNAVVLEAQSFTTDFVYNYTSAAAQAGTQAFGTNVPSGEWTLNGATVNIPYMPYGPSASQVIYVTNAGTQDGDISVTAFDNNGTSYDLGVVGTANAMTVTKLATVVNNALQAAGFDGRQASITVTVNAPEDDITVHASFNIGGSDRAFVITDQYKGIE